MKGLLSFLYYFIIYIRVKWKNKSIKELILYYFLVLFIVFIKNTVNFCLRKLNLIQVEK